MFAKASIIAAIFAVSAQVVAADSNPGCMLAAVNAQPDPSDIKAVCQKSSEVKSDIKDKCNEYADEATKAFVAICKNANVAVSADDNSSSSSSSSSARVTSSSSASGAKATGGSLQGTSTITYTSHYYDTECSCTKTTIKTGNAYTGPTGVSTATGVAGNGTYAAATAGGNYGGSAVPTGSSSSGASGASGSGSGSGSASGSGSGNGTASSPAMSEGAAGRLEIGGLTFGAIAAAALAFAL